MSHNEVGAIKILRITEVLYLFTFSSSLCFLLLSRTGEAHTIWEVLSPFFIPTLFAAAFLLLTILLASEKVAYKLFFVIIYSVLVHSFFSIIFPAGDLSGQQIVLGRTRLVFDNVVYNGWTPWPWLSLGQRVFEWFRGITFQASLSVVIARMLSIDVLWVHLFLVPVLWGVFVPIAAFKITKVIGGSDKVAALASLLTTVFPYATYFGAISVPISLGFIFFFYSLYFTLKYLGSDDSKTRFLMIALAFFSFNSHFLTGIVSFSLIFLASALKFHRSEKSSGLVTSSFVVVMWVLCCSLLPTSFVYLRFLGVSTNASFSLNKFYQLPLGEAVGLALIGDLIYSSESTALLVIAGSVIAFLCMIYILYRTRGPNSESWLRTLFLFAAFLLILVDYGVMKLFMTNLPLNEERLWVIRDLLAVPFLSVAVYALISFLQRVLRPRLSLALSIHGVRKSSRRALPWFLTSVLLLNVVIPIGLSSWFTASLGVAYPQVAPLQTTWYELEAVRYIDANTHEPYVVIADQWIIFAGEVVVGVNNPRAYYFLEFNRTGRLLFVNMSQDPSPKWMLLAMNYTDTAVAYFVVSEPRLGMNEFQNVVSRALQNQQLTAVNVPIVPVEKLRVFAYRRG